MIKVVNKLIVSSKSFVLILLIVLVLSVIITLIVSNFILGPQNQKPSSSSQGVVTVIVAPKESQDQGVVTVVVEGGKNG